MRNKSSAQSEASGQVAGIHFPVPPKHLARHVRIMRDTYACKPNTPFYRREFGYYCLEQWYEQGLDRSADFSEVFGYDPTAKHDLGELGWCEAAFCPTFEERVVEDRGEYELVQDKAGRHVLCFKGRRSGFMPEYVNHPVKDERTWREHCLWRLDPDSPERYADIEQRMRDARRAATEGLVITQRLVGGYMYLRSLMGPEEVLYMFYDGPELIQACMQRWFELADAVIARHQQHVTIDELFLAEDICYNHGILISPELMRRFLLPYYQQLIDNLKSRQLDKTRHLYIQVDTDGFADPAIPVYREIGLDVMSPFEVAAGCDVVDTGRRYPDMVLFGGIDKRVLARGRDAIDRHLAHVLPAMHRRGGYIPTSDHGVPEEVSLENYLYYRKKCQEYSVG